MVQRMQRVILARRIAHRLERDVGEHFIDVHVRARARAALPCAHDDMLIEFAADHRFARAGEGCVLLVGQIA